MMHAAQRRYMWRVGVAMTAFLASLFLADYWIEDRGLQGPSAVALALLPGLCVASVFWLVGRFYLEQDDEYRRMLLIRQLLIASGITLTVLTIWGFLADFGIVAHAGGFYPMWVFFIGLGVGGLANRLALGDS